jgi:hypothetical protein
VLRADARLLLLSADPGGAERAPILDPLDRNSEVLFGVFMCLTFTGTLSVASATGEDVRNMLIAAIGCNTAWGFVDAVMYVLRAVVGRGAQVRLVREVRDAADPDAGRAIVSANLPPAVGNALGAEGMERIRRHLAGLTALPARPALEGADFKAGLAVFLLVFLSTFPLVLPFVLLDDLHVAMRASGAVAIAILFLCGYNWGRHAGLVPLRAGVVMVMLGVLVEAIIIALGG